MFDEYYYDNYYDGDYDEDPEEMEYERYDKIEEKVDLFKTNTEYLSENVWLDGKDFDCSFILKHNFQNHIDDTSSVVLFGLEISEDNSHTLLNLLSIDIIEDENLFDEPVIIKRDFEHTKNIVNNIINHFDKKQNFSLEAFNTQMEKILEDISVQNLKEFGADPEKMLDWDKKLGEQSDYVKKAIDPFLTTGDDEYWIKLFNNNPNNVKEYLLNNCEVSDLFDRLSDKGVFKGDEKPVVEKLKSIGIEGCIYDDRTDVYNDEYLEKINLIHEKHFKYKWGDAEAFSDVNDDLKGEYLKNYAWYKEEPSFFVVQPLDHNNSSIMFFRNKTDIMDHKAKVYVDSNLDIDTAKKIVEKTSEHFTNLEEYKLSDMKDFIIQQLPAQTIIFDQWPATEQTTPLQIPVSDRQLENAQIIGYVIGVCKSVLAFNTDENRKIMSESTMNFLSRKLFAEMNVTKDMVQKFADPETYKALEKCVFAPAQEQHLEQTQSQGISR